MKTLSIDFETSDFHENGGVPIEFGAVLVDEVGDVMDTFLTRMRLEEGEEISPEAFKCHGITKEDLENEPSRAEALNNFRKWLLENLIVPTNKWQIQILGQNVAFDMKFFWDWWGKEYRGMFHYTQLDTMIITEIMNRVIGKIDGWDCSPFVKANVNGTIVPSASLEAQCQTFGFDYGGAHNALEDAQLTLKCWNTHVTKLEETIMEARVC